MIANESTVNKQIPVNTRRVRPWTPNQLLGPQFNDMAASLSRNNETGTWRGDPDAIDQGERLDLFWESCRHDDGVIGLCRALVLAQLGALFWCYLAVPVQYYLAYKGYYSLFLIFIPIFMHVWIPFILVIRGVTEDIGRAMAVLPTQLMLTVFGISHLAFLLALPSLTSYPLGGRGLLLFVVFITEMNDVFQFTWGKLFGRYKIIPKVSPNKTWEGFIGGIATSTVVGCYLRFLTPFSFNQALIISFSVACAGFIGDVVVSALKRDIGKKDTGNTIPGHGGILDRIDSLAMTAPVFFHIVYNLFYVNL